jgi:hypothetical protein
LFNVVERSGNYVFEDKTPPTALRASFVSYALGVDKVFIESVVVKLQKGLTKLEIQRASALFNN